MHVVIIGAGRIGKAIGGVAAAEGHEVSYWDAVLGVVPDQQPLAEIVPSAELLILCNPSWTVRESLLSFRDFLKPAAILLSFAKGIERETRKTVDEIFSELVPVHACGMVGGPMMAEEITKGQGGVAVIGIVQANAFQRVSEAFARSMIRFERASDVHGVALAGVLKNVYALGLGIADALEWGVNRKGWYVSQAVKEMCAIMQRLGGSPETVIGPAGIGDFIATGFSPHSRNRHVGEEVVRTGKCCIKSEATVSMGSLIELLGPAVEDLPVLRGLASIAKDERSAREVFMGLTASAEAGIL